METNTQQTPAEPVAAPVVGSDGIVVLGLTTAMDNYQRHWQQLAKVSYQKASHYENMEGTQAALIGARHRQIGDAYEHCRSHIQRLLASAKKRQPQHNSGDVPRAGNGAAPKEKNNL